MKEKKKKNKRARRTRSTVHHLHDYDEMISSIIDDIAFWRDIASDSGLLHSPLLVEEWKGEVRLCEMKALSILDKLVALSHNNVKAKVALVGDFSSGKSSILNSLLGKAVCPVDIEPTTKAITRFCYATEKSIWQKTTISKPSMKDASVKGGLIPVSTADYMKFVQHQDGRRDFKNKVNQIDIVEFEYRYPWDGLVNTVVCDTPGFENAHNQGDSDLTMKVILDEADVLLWVSDIQQGGLSKSNVDKMLGIHKERPSLPIYLILNKAENKPHKNCEKICQEALEQSKGAVLKAIPYSANVVTNLSASDPVLVAKKEIENYVEAILKEGCSTDFRIDYSKNAGRRSNIIHAFTFNNLKVELKARHLEFRHSRRDLLEIFNEIAKKKQTYAKLDIGHDISEYLPLAHLGIKKLSEILQRSTFDYDLFGAESDLKQKMRDLFNHSIEELVLSSFSISFKLWDKPGLIFGKNYFTEFRYDRLLDGLTAKFLEKFGSRYVVRTINDATNKIIDNYGISLPFESKIYKENLKDLAGRICRNVDSSIDKNDKHVQEHGNKEDRNDFKEKLCSKVLRDISFETYENLIFKPIEEWFVKAAEQMKGQMNVHDNHRLNLDEKLKELKKRMLKSPLKDLL